MTKPTVVKISGQKYRIKYDLPETGTEADSLGETIQATNTIRIQPNLQDDKTAGVVLHEITHAIIDESVMSGRKRFNIEEVCDIVGYHVLGVLKDNTALTQWLLTDGETHG